MRLKDLGEDGFLRRIRARFQNPAVTVGIGDDAAILEAPPAGHRLVYCCDLVVENTHFIRGMHPPDAVGYKAVAVNVSDVGAMGGTPLFIVISFAAPGDLELAWVDEFYSGIEKACRKFDVALVGGDTSSAASIFADVAIIGSVRGKAVLRSGAQPGDSIYVTGTLGASVLGFEQLRSGVKESIAVQRHLYPEPRHRVGAAVAGVAHAMIDVSDGLSTDLRHIVSESRVSARIDKSSLPAAAGAQDEQVLHGGEEYELLITAPELPAEIEGVRLTRIGEIVRSVEDRHEVFMVDGAKESVLQPQGWDHYGNS
jgi:thiamine-monophosphate kinase